MQNIKFIFVLQIVILTFSFIYCSDDKENPVIIEDKDTVGTSEYELVWSDEFDDNQLDLNKWEYEVNADGGGNNELQYYTDRNVNTNVNNGILKITALNEEFSLNGETRNYTSSRIRTLNRGDWLYAKIEVKAKLPFGQGLWPAIWMLPTDWEYGTWAASGEIDIMELLGHEPNKIHGTLHYGGEWPNNLQSGDSYQLNSGTFSDDFHVFSIEWELGEFKWFVEGEHYLTRKVWNSSGGNYPAPFNKQFHLLLNVAVGGNWPGNPNAQTTFPQVMEVDYVRVFQKN